MAPDPPAPAASPTTSLPVVETFHSLQGEGVHAGRGAFFIRLGGCSVGCSWCDTKHSWPQAAHPHRTIHALAAAAAEAAEAGAAFVVITGGEPLEHPLGDLCAALNTASPNLPLHLETSGVHRLSGHFDWITLSPKPHHPPSGELLARCHELKVVVHGPRRPGLCRPPWPRRPAAAAAPRPPSCCSSRAGEASGARSWRWTMCGATPTGASACRATSGWGCAEGRRVQRVSGGRQAWASRSSWEGLTWNRCWKSTLNRLMER